MHLKYKVYNYFITEPLKKKCHEVLLEWNNYYQRLGTPERQEFAIRTLIFIRSVRFESETGFPLTQEMKIVLGGAFVQVTFGLSQDAPEHFNRIFLFSQPYSYSSLNALFLGDVNPITGTINLSWPSIAKGFVVPTDGMNLALHEFAHCLILENTRRSYLQTSILHSKNLQEWKKLAFKEMIRIRRGENKLFRHYAGTNLMELFAVSLETFFERPYAFYAETPEFFKSMCLLLRQDPRDTKSPKAFLRSA